jgi:hypothetical protein
MKELIGNTQEIQQQKELDTAANLENYRKMGVVQTFVLQGDNDEECERDWLSLLGVAQDETLYAIEAGSVLKEVKDSRESK